MENNFNNGKSNNYRPNNYERPIAQVNNVAVEPTPATGMLQKTKNVVTSKPFIIGAIAVAAAGACYFGYRYFFGKKKEEETAKSEKADTNE